jgi:tetraacyldisaccharide 4'-kinase
MSAPGARLLASAHQAVVGLRNRLHDSGRLKAHALPRPVISVGNLTLGGTGKTPFVESLARLLSEEGYLTCILSRGYGGSRAEDPLVVSDYRHIRVGATHAGDEPYLLARKLPGVAVVVGANRFEAGLLALEQFPVHLFLLDDGFQHRALRRDVDIVLLDATNPWGGNALLPAGTLREPRAALRRAHAIGLTRLHQCEPAAAKALQGEIQAAVPGVPLFGTRSITTGIRELPNGRIRTLDAVKGRRVVAFAGIGRPEAFFRDLEAAGATIVARRIFRDHHPYRASDVAELLDEASRCAADAMVTTEKDAVRLPAPPRRALPFFALRQEVGPEDPQGLLRFLVSKLPQPAARGSH